MIWPRPKTVVSLIAVSLTRWITSRSKTADQSAVTISHAVDLQRAMIVFASVEVLVATLASRLFPGVWQLVHLIAEVFVVAAYLGLAACWRIHPHLLDNQSLLLRTGVFGDTAVPLSAIASVRSEERAAGGYGIRMAKVEDETLACSVTSQTNVVIELMQAYPFQLKTNDVVSARRVRANVDEPSEFGRLLSRAMQSRTAD
jgi:hypothetical protein